MQAEKTLLLAGVVAPILYFTLLFVAGTFYPDFNHIKQVASELGADGAPYGGMWAFNIGLVVVGLIGMAGAVGLFRGLQRVGSGNLWAVVTGIAMASPCVTWVTSGLFPLPHPWHANIYIVLFGFLTPLFGVLAIRRAPDTGVLKGVLAAGFVLSVAALIGFGGLLDADMSGLRWRLVALFLLGSVAYLCWTVRARI